MCAEFIGLKYGWWISQEKPLTDDKKQWWDIDGKTFLGTKVYFNKDLCFHSDWNWIMEVAKKIKKTTNPKDYSDTTFGTLRRNVQHKLGISHKKGAVQAIYDFLLWYIQNKQSSHWDNVKDAPVFKFISDETSKKMKR